MALYSDDFSGRPACILYIDITESSTNSAANTSNVTFTMYIIGNNASFNGFTNSSGNLTVNGEVFNIAGWTYDFSVNNTKVLVGSTTRTITHNTDGSKSISVSGTATDGNGGTPLGTATIGTQTFVLTDFSRVPEAPAAPTLTRNDAGTTITVLSAVATSPITITDYEYRQSTDNSTWGSAVSMGTDRTIDVTSLTNTQVYYYQTRAVNADGNGAWSASQISNGAPATITAVRTGRNVAVTAGNATGSGITGYYVQYSTNSGSTWSTAQAMTSQAYTYTSLTPALTYLFRVYAAAPSGDTGKTVSAGVFVPAGGKRWDGSAFISTSTGKRWNGSAWIDLTVAKRWNGSSWTDLS